jgi:hypothetical protein
VLFFYGLLEVFEVFLGESFDLLVEFVKSTADELSLDPSSFSDYSFSSCLFDSVSPHSSTGAFISKGSLLISFMSTLSDMRSSEISFSFKISGIPEEHSDS